MPAQLLTITSAELQRRFRSKSALITAFGAPLAMAVVFGLMLGNTDTAPDFTIGVVDDGTSAQSAGIVAALVSEEAIGVSFVELVDPSDAERQVDDADVGAALVIGDGPSATVPELTVLANPASPLSAQVAQSVASSIATSIETSGAAPVEIESIPLGGRPLDSSAFFGASMAILLLFFASGAAAESILEDKNNSTLDRMLSGPTTVWSILLGKVAAVAVLSTMSFFVVWAVTSIVFGAEWGDPAAVAVLIVFTVIALSGVATFVGGLASTSQQALTLTAVVTFGLSLIGGNFTGPADAPAALRTLRGLTPNGRALEAFTEVSVDASSIRSLALTVLVLFLFGAVFGAIGLVSIRRKVQA